MREVDCASCSESAVITGTTDPGLYTGLAGAMYATVDVRRDNVRARTYFMLYGGQDLPPAGRRCDIYWEWTVIAGLAHEGMIRNQLKPVAIEILCDDNLYRFGGPKSDPADGNSAPH